MFEDDLPEVGPAFFFAAISSQATRSAVLDSAATLRMLRLPPDWHGFSSPKSAGLIARAAAGLEKQRLQTAKPSPDTFVAYLAASSTYDFAATASPTAAASASFLAMFAQRLDGLRSVRLIHPLAAAFSWFAAAFTGRVSLVDVRDGLTVADAIEQRLPAALRSSAAIALKSFMASWTALRAELGSGSPLSAFDSSAPARLADVLHIPGEPLCALAAALQDRLLPLVNDFMGAPELRALRSATEAAGLNLLSANVEAEAVVVDVQTLPRKHADAARVLLTGRRLWSAGEARSNHSAVGFEAPLARFIASHASPKGAATPQSPGAALSRWEYDLPAIAAYVLSRYVAGRPALEMRGLLRAAELRLLRAVQRHVSVGASAAASDEDDVYHADEVVLRLRMAAEQVKEALGRGGSAPQPSDADRRVTRGVTERATEANLKELLGDLLTTCEVAVRAAGDDGAAPRSGTLRELLQASGLPGGGPLAKKLSRFSLCAGLRVSALPALAEAVADAVEGQVRVAGREAG